jgi:hypothetical protein
MKRLVTGLAAAGVLLAGCGSASSPPAKPKTKTPVASGPTYFLGNKPANLTGEKYVPMNGSAVCTAAGTLCYGGGVNSGGATDVPAIAPVSTQGGVISGYTENFPANTPLLTAEEQVLSSFPPDTLGFGNRTPTAKSGGCGDISVTSPAIAKLSALGDPTGTITIAFSYIDPSSLNNVYDASNIQQAEVVAGTTPTS